MALFIVVSTTSLLIGLFTVLDTIDYNNRKQAYLAGTSSISRPVFSLGEKGNEPANKAQVSFLSYRLESLDNKYAVLITIPEPGSGNGQFGNWTGFPGSPIAKGSWVTGSVYESNYKLHNRDWEVYIGFIQPAQSVELSQEETKFIEEVQSITSSEVGERINISHPYLIFGTEPDTIVRLPDETIGQQGANTLRYRSTSGGVDYALIPIDEHWIFIAYAAYNPVYDLFPEIVSSLRYEEI